MTRVKNCFGTLEGDIEFYFHSNPVAFRAGGMEAIGQRALQKSLLSVPPRGKSVGSVMRRVDDRSWETGRGSIRDIIDR